MEKRRMSFGARMTIKIISVVLIIAMTVFVTVGAMNPFGFFEYGNFFSFWRATNRISRIYHGEVTPDQLFEGAMRGVAESVGDPFTRYIDREDSAAFMTMITGEFYGIGLYIAESEYGYVVVLAPIPNTPAERAGIASGDVIVKVDGEEVFDSHVASSMMRGPEGTEVVVTVRKWDTDEIVDLEITRARVLLTTVDSRMFDDNIVYFAISRFASTTTSELLEKFNELETSPSGIIIDLRNNGGGIVNVAVDIAGFFLPDRTLVVYSEGRGMSRREYRTRGENLTDVPIVFITNMGSASASEILVGALRDHGRAISVGETTFGKGSIQVSFPVRGGGNLNITGARYFTPNGTDIEGEGIEPDIIVELPEGHLPLSLMADADDTQLQAAINELREAMNQ
ncbi:MAG: S41 family peptidase [Oscillospiraceae bacterium]|nr:S41 family peptidase [Oscillospiraceae bacterium]